jgi:hypothetical protein
MEQNSPWQTNSRLFTTYTNAMRPYSERVIPRCKGYLNSTIRVLRGQLYFYLTFLPNRVGVSPPPNLKTEADPVSETLCFLLI